MTVKNKLEITTAAILISAAIILSGCSGTAQPEAVKSVNANQTAIVTGNNANSSGNVYLPGNVNSSLPASNTNNAIAVSPNAQASIAGNSSSATAGKNQKTTPVVPAPTPNIGSGGDDFSLFTQARAALSSDKELTNGVIIEIKQGNATLNGKVSSEEQKIKAERLVQNVAGIKSVKSSLVVSP